MSKGAAKKSRDKAERRKHSRSAAATSTRPSLRSSEKSSGHPATKSATARPKPALNKQESRVPNVGVSPNISQDICFQCSTALTGDDQRALFVEEEVGRVFCSEACIAAYFTPEIERLEKEFFRRLTPSDLTAEERESLAHLRWITLQEPDEAWREKTLSGDYRYTLISEFKPGSKKIWSICICLLLRGEPSFLYLAFSTKNPAMVNHYRRGERVEWVKQESSQKTSSKNLGEGNPAAVQGTEEIPASGEKLDCLADAWTEDETVLAQLNKGRSSTDIPPNEYGLYQACLEETLETPDEVWCHDSGGEDSIRLFHFIRHYPDEKPGVWFVIVARETENEENIEIIDAFPTRDSTLVEHYRRGEQEFGQTESKVAARVVH